jgi:hypothetical protein
MTRSSAVASAVRTAVRELECASGIEVKPPQATVSLVSLHSRFSLIAGGHSFHNPHPAENVTTYGVSILFRRLTQSGWVRLGIKQGCKAARLLRHTPGFDEGRARVFSEYKNVNDHSIDELDDLGVSTTIYLALLTPTWLLWEPLNPGAW